LSGPLTGDSVWPTLPAGCRSRWSSSTRYSLAWRAPTRARLRRAAFDRSATSVTVLIPYQADGASLYLDVFAPRCSGAYRPSHDSRRRPPRPRQEIPQV